MNNFIKIDECLYQDIIDNNLNIDDYLLNNVVKRKNSLEYGTICDMNSCLIDCESPIEQILSLTMNFMGLRLISKYNNFIDLCISNNQEIICKNGEKYRLDFYIIVLYKDEKGNRVKNCYFDIECDGYKFHQKTKEQIIYDNERERNLKKEGYEIIRFSGSEINSNPYKCVQEIIDIILSKCNYLKYNKEI